MIYRLPWQTVHACMQMLRPVAPARAPERINNPQSIFWQISRIQCCGPSQEDGKEVGTSDTLNLLGFEAAPGLCLVRKMKKDKMGLDDFYFVLYVLF